VGWVSERRIFMLGGVGGSSDSRRMSGGERGKGAGAGRGEGGG